MLGQNDFLFSVSSMGMAISLLMQSFYCGALFLVETGVLGNAADPARILRDSLKSLSFLSLLFEARPATMKRSELCKGK